MTIKEVESRTGMTRANVRFYETEGLITPERGSNGYRNYSEQDVAVLLRIKLLRLLEMPLEEIKHLQTGEEDLLSVLDSHIQRLEARRAHLERSQQVCREMRRDGVRFDTLDPQPYLAALDREDKVPAEDVLPRVYSPWRRYFARMLDQGVYTLLCYLVIALALRENILANSNFYSTVAVVVGIVLTLFLEPLLLCCFGTTPGKAILGLHVTDGDGGRLTYGAAYRRALRVLGWGYGIHIPIFTWVRLWKSYKACTSGETLPWEEESTLVLKDERGWRTAAAIGFDGLLLALTMLVLLMPPRAEHRGELTVAEFAQNYNFFAQYYEMDAAGVHQLDERGAWVDRENSNVIVFGDDSWGTYSFEEENGVVTSVTFTRQEENEDVYLLGDQSELYLAVLAFAGEDLSRQELKDLSGLQERCLESWQTTAFGMIITWEVDYSGFIQVDLGQPALWVEEDENSYSVVLTLTRE